MYYLTNSDFLYKEVFVSKATEIVQREEPGRGDCSGPPRFFDDPDLASRTQAQQIHRPAQERREPAGCAWGGYRQGHGAAGRPSRSPTARPTTSTSSDQLAFLVTVENQGNMSEKDVPVLVTLGAQTGEPQKVTVTIPRTQARREGDRHGKGAQPHAVWRRSHPQSGRGCRSAGEKFIDNNSIEANVIFKL